MRLDRSIFKKYRYNFLFAFGFLGIVFSFEFFSFLFVDNYASTLKLIRLENILLVLATGLVISFMHRYVVLFVAFVLVLASVLEVAYYMFFGSYIQAIDFYQFFIHFSEVSESLGYEYKLLVLASLAFVMYAVVCIIFINKIDFKTHKSGYAYLILAMLLYGDVFYKYKGMNYEKYEYKLSHGIALRVLPTSDSFAFANFYGSFQYFVLRIVPNKIMDSKNKFSDTIFESPKKLNSINANIIFIIGESLGSDKMSLFGYNKNITTPKLQNRDDIYSSVVYAGGTFTKTSVAVLLNRLKYPGQTAQISKQNNCLFNLAKQNSFQTYFVSNQESRHLTIVDNLICKKYIDTYLSGDDLAKPLFDINLVNFLEEINFDKNNFIVLQQRGSHLPYALQSPKSFKKLNSEYENSVLYTDFVLDRLITKIKEQKTDKDTYIVFTSDHGEFVGERNLWGHGHFEKEIYEVPFIYFSNKDSYTDEVKNIKSHFDISNFVSKLLGYDTKIDNDEIYINGTDLDALAGYLHIKDTNITRHR
ncbi:MAG: Unknown protein [uncultured Campylobacterales bacterium]|uniref:Sulfatase N-terminal domain-containing protein n=1 Tax=uncultured Campylobacterales bacterium TaxID=352960 RepID=A0A6S6SDQ4_9BACT|nr:MAG: Unknown protein [uncultured Campylobacterales bacterium]